MPKILVLVSEGQKVLWVGAAHYERVSLSEWVRRRCDAGLGAGEPEAWPDSARRVDEEQPGGSRAVVPSPAPSSARSFRPDFKKGK